MAAGLSLTVTFPAQATAGLLHVSLESSGVRVPLPGGRGDAAPFALRVEDGTGRPVAHFDPPLRLEATIAQADLPDGRQGWPVLYGWFGGEEGWQPLPFHWESTTGAVIAPLPHIVPLGLGELPARRVYLPGLLR